MPVQRLPPFQPWNRTFYLNTKAFYFTSPYAVLSANENKYSLIPCFFPAYCFVKQITLVSFFFTLYLIGTVFGFMTGIKEVLCFLCGFLYY